VRWGILSTGHIASVLTRDLALLPDEAEVVAVGSRSQEKADAFAEEHGLRRAYGSYEDLTADPDLDVIYVASVHNDHLASARLCLEAGKAVLVEKPLTTSADDIGGEHVGVARPGPRPRTLPDGGDVEPDEPAAPQGSGAGRGR
jgi:predicted dehydrogenase